MIDEEQVMACALAATPQVGLSRLGGLLLRNSPTQVWQMLNLHDDELLARMEVALERARIGVTYIGRHDYPATLLTDPARPSVLFFQGSLEHLAHRRVGVIGTRGATASGRYMASHLGYDLAVNGVSVVSGLARGIDAWAHRGVMVADSRQQHIAPPIAVVASGLDVVYPRDNLELWKWVAREGVVLSESPPGTAPEAFRFPLRNRILAALSEVIVVVESREKGGSMITVEEAMKRDITVMAVPGSPRNSSSAGSNLLLQQGCAPVVSVDDVLVALGLDHRRCHPHVYDSRPQPGEFDKRVIEAIGREALTLDQVMMRLGSELVPTAVALGRLESHGWLANNAGWWEVLGQLPVGGYGGSEAGLLPLTGAHDR